MRTLSKFGLAGVRLGYLIGPQALIAEIDKVRPPYNISVLNAEARAVRAGARRGVRGAGRRAARRAHALHAALARAGRASAGRATPTWCWSACPMPQRLRRHEGARGAGQERFRNASVAGQLPAPDRRHARRKRADAGSTRSIPMTTSHRSSTAADAPRTAEVTRNTAETQITRALNLDGTGRPSCAPASASSTTCSTRSRATA